MILQNPQSHSVEGLSVGEGERARVVSAQNGRVKPATDDAPPAGDAPGDGHPEDPRAADPPVTSVTPE